MIGKRLKEVRKYRGLTQADLAKKIGVSLGSIKKWEQDQVDPNTNALISICVALEVSTDYLFGRDVPMDLIVETPDDVKRIIEVTSSLPEAHRKALLQYAELLKKGIDDDK